MWNEAVGLREARKLFRLFKSIDEYQAILHLVFYGAEELSTVLHIFSKALYAVYWMLDNLSVAAKVKILTFKWKYLHRLALKVRFFALIVGVLTFCYELKVKGLSGEEKVNKSLKAGKNLFDLLPAAKDSGLFPQVYETLAGLGGLVSAVVSTCQIYEEQVIHPKKDEEEE